MHGPKLALRPGSFRRLSGLLGIWMLVGEREVTENNPQPVAQFGAKSLRNRIRAATIGAFKITVCHQSDTGRSEPMT